MQNGQTICVGSVLEMSIPINRNLEGYETALIMSGCWGFLSSILFISFNRSQQRNQPGGKTPINTYFINQLLASYIHF